MTHFRVVPSTPARTVVVRGSQPTQVDVSTTDPAQVDVTTPEAGSAQVSTAAPPAADVTVDREAARVLTDLPFAVPGPPGPPGPMGPPGQDGGGVAPGGDPGQVLGKNTTLDFDTVWVNAFYRHYQVSAATTWTVTHNLGFRPNVAVEDSSGADIVPGEIRYLDLNTLALDFSAAVGGEAYLS